MHDSGISRTKMALCRKKTISDTHVLNIFIFPELFMIIIVSQLSMVYGTQTADLKAAKLVVSASYQNE